MRGEPREGGTEEGKGRHFLVEPKCANLFFGGKTGGKRGKGNGGKGGKIWGGMRRGRCC